MIADEVICGFGRTGNFWGSETVGIKPNILTCAKSLSASYLPISAVMITDAAFQPIAPADADLTALGRGYTHYAHPPCAAAPLANIGLASCCERVLAALSISVVDAHLKQKIIP